MIVNIRGTSGSGKTTLAREIMSWYRTKRAVFAPGRKHPLYYKLWLGDEETPMADLIVVGHYEGVCGGCDTITSFDTIFNVIIEAQANLAHHVLYEGLLLSLEIGRAKELHDIFPGQLMVVALDVPLQTCIDSVNARRLARNPDAKPLDPELTTQKWNTVRRTMTRLDEEGVTTIWAERAVAPQIVRQALNVLL